MTDENAAPEPQESEAQPEPETVVVKQDILRTDCDRCPCEDCPGAHPDTTAELAEHSKACPEKHF